VTSDVSENESSIVHPMPSACVARSALVLILAQQTSVVAKLVTPKMGATGEQATQLGPELTDLEEHLESLVRDTSEEPEMATVQAAFTSKKTAGKRRAMRGAGTENVRANLISELIATFREGANHERLAKWEAAMAAMFAALPKNPQGNLGHAAAKYALHRAFVQRHSWSMSGLEPSDATWSASSPLGSLKTWVPEYLLELIEQLLGTQGINLRELSVLAATFEDLAHKEAINRLQEIFETLSLRTADPIDKDMTQYVIKMYMTMYTSAHGLYAKTFKDVMELGLNIDGETQSWLDEVQRNMSSQDGVSEKFDFVATTRVVEEIGERFGSFNDRECRALKSILVGMETTRRPGRVALSDFYKEGMTQSYWSFNEKVEYLRVLGALDESDSTKPQLIIPNYINSRSNCLVSSNFYAVCCRNECEDLLGHLENEVGAPMADPKNIAEIVASIPSVTIKAKQNLSKTLLVRLQEVASVHNGKVPLHGRMFAQWMHHAFPQECPYPHVTEGNPQTPDEWMKESGSAKASKEEMLKYIHNETVSPRVTLSSHKEELPWSSVEMLVDEHHPSVLFKANVGQATSRLRWAQYSCLLLAVVVVLALAAFRSILKSPEETSYSKKFDSDVSGYHGWNIQSFAVQGSPMNVKRRHKMGTQADLPF